MLVLFTCCWGSNLSIQAEVGKLNGDLLQPSGIRYEVWSFSVRHLISIAYWKGLISGVKLSIVVLQAIWISLCNRIGDSAGDVPCFYLGVCGHNGLDIIDLLSVPPSFCVAFYSMFVHWHSPLLVWPWPAFYHCLLCIRGFFANTRVYTRVFGQKARTYAAVLYIVMYILPFGESDVVGSCWVGCECGWVFLRSEVVCAMPLLWTETVRAAHRYYVYTGI